ncbi:IucA/IucC family protein [Paenibacillus daejeonensis]|uniref:IucA/IucC family protein n=1 Tax=Paenibacillus daejeonensis TaxID=135193 RepID=UPI00036E2734|nr:IucA/IucC family protein [Paenibacillus daejeonensis]
MSTVWEQEALHVQAALRSRAYTDCRQRIMRQLLESLIYEQLVPCDIAAPMEETGHTGNPDQAATRVFVLRGTQNNGKRVNYRCQGRITASFGRVRLNHLIIRSDEQGRRPADSLALLMTELFRNSEVKPAHLAVFIRELEETLLKDTLSVFHAGDTPQTLQELTYYELEAALPDGHRYHPSYKSRIGFDYRDNQAYGPEFAPALQLLWLAVSEQWTYSAIAEGWSFPELLIEELGEEAVERFAQMIRTQGRDSRQYKLLPVHPWQWQHQLAHAMAPYIHAGEVIVLGLAGELYQPLQSIRTLHNQERQGAPNVKLAMSLINTSASRYLSPHSVASAPAVSGWLQSMVDGDAYLRDEAKLVLLHEFAGVVFDPPPADPCVEPQIYGVLACLWRDNLELRLLPEESAVPFNSLCYVDKQGVAYIDPWIQRLGAEAWWRELVRRTVLPVAHLLIAHGVALESHGQNMILIHRDGLPARAALKDFHEGYYYCKSALAAPEACPNFAAIHENFTLAPVDALFEQSSEETVRDTLMDALLLFNLGEITWVLDRHYDLSESRCWAIVVDELEAHRDRHPELEQRYQQFDLYVPLCEVESLTRGRLYPDVNATYTHTAANPLAVALRGRKQEITTGGNLC